MKMSSLYESLTYVFRNIGLDSISFSIRKWKLHSAPENKKVVINRSLWIALSRCWIHVLPASVSIALVILNMKGKYIGRTLGGSAGGDTEKLGVIQIAAKVQELLIIGSLATIIFYSVRDRLIHGEGVPLGLLMSGFNFGRLSFFWSPAFLAGFFWKDKLQAKVFLLGTVALAGLLAALAGPASAVLMLPRITPWAKINGHFWLDGTASEYWPTILTAQHVGPSRCVGEQSLFDIEYISSGLPNLVNYYSTRTDTFRDEWFNSFLTADKAFARNIYLVPASSYQSPDSAWSTVPHAATALLQASMWWAPVWYRTDKNNWLARASQATAQAPAVRLPALPEFEYWVSSTCERFFNDKCHGRYANVTLNGTLWGAGNSVLINDTGISTAWIPGVSSIGAVTAAIVVLGPLVSTNHTTRYGVACSLDARWALSLQAETADSAAAGVARAPISNTIITQRDVGPVDSLYGFRAVDDGTWRRIYAEPAWLDALTPLVTTFNRDRGGSARTTALANLMLAGGIDLRSGNMSIHKYWVADIEAMLSVALTDAISRVGFSKQFQSKRTYTDIIPPSKYCSSFATSPWGVFCPGEPRSGNSTKIPIIGNIEGYAFLASSTVDYLAIAVLLFHVTMALLHAVHTVSTRRSSSAWETLEEVVVLAQNSLSDEKLEGTCAGIQSFETMGRVAKVRHVQSGVMASDEGTGGRGVVNDGELLELIEDVEGRLRRGEELMLLFSEEDGRHKYGKVIVGKKYGKIA